jgi:hypothetical protein
MSAQRLYTLGRAAAVLTRPSFLFVANNFLTPNTAENLAVAFLASALALAFVAAAPHRRFYITHFDPDVIVNGLSFYVYAMSVALLIVAGSVFVLLMSMYFSGSIALACATVVYFSSEKIADELLRLRLFERNLAGWGAASLARSAVQLGGFAVLLGLMGNGVAALPAVLALALGNLVVFPRQLPVHLRRSFSLRSKRMARLARRAIRSMVGNWILWVLALFGTGVGYLDRVVALSVDRTVLPLFTLVVMCFSIVQLAVSYYYVSQHRRDFLERGISIRGAFCSKDFLGSFIGGLAVASCMCAVVLPLSRGGDQFPLLYLIVIAALQALLAAVDVPREIAYWKGHLKAMLRIEVTIWVTIACALLGAWWGGLSGNQILGLVVGFAALRCGLYAIVAGSERGERLHQSERLPLG